MARRGRHPRRRVILGLLGSCVEWRELVGVLDLGACTNRDLVLRLCRRVVNIRSGRIETTQLDARLTNGWSDLER